MLQVKKKKKKKKKFYVNLLKKNVLREINVFHLLGNYPSRCSAAKGAELDSAAAKQKVPFAAVWREAGAYII